MPQRTQHGIGRQAPQAAERPVGHRAAQILDERRMVLDTLRKRGVLTLDVPANQLSLAVINRYLELKGKTML